MYDDCDYERSYYEPTLADEIFAEYQEKMKEALHETIKNEIQAIKEENAKLKKENEECKKREREISNKERDLKHKEENLKRVVENEFYESNIGETLKRYIEDCELWFADETKYQEEKCNLCNEKRKLVAEFANGKTSEITCECAKWIKKFQPALTIEAIIIFAKRNSGYRSDSSFYLSKTYEPSKDSEYYQKEYSYSEFKIGYIIDEFNEDTMQIYKSKKYGYKLGFRSKEECQKYCDWLNSNIKTEVL